MKEKKEILKKAVKKIADGPVIKSANLFPVVGIGASAGGLDAFKKLLKAIPEDSGMAYVLVQHLDPSHESLLQELLQKATNIPVLEITDDIKVEPNHIYVIPSNKMMVATDGILLLAPRPAKSKNERNLPIDLFFTSLAEVHQSHAIGVVLSGTASDGTLGLKAIKDHGGITFAQDEASAAYNGMPHSAAQAGVVDFILPPEKIPQKLLEVTNIINGNGRSEESVPIKDEDVFRQILSLLRIRKGTDFTYYKQTTIRRRILRRMAINKNEEPAAYLKYLRDNKPEQDILYQDLLIPVTGFFRDPKTFDNLCESVFPLIVKNKTTGNEPIRIWVAGCSTGEEAYSIAICLKEFLGGSSLPFGEGQGGGVQIFATDISEPAIAKARAGIYSKSDVEGLTTQRLQDFFIHQPTDSYQANKSIRDMCVFAVHNFLKDPPFGKMDFISCRNVLIYMEPYLQKKALTTFHYALNAKGFLLLGKSETTGGVPELFNSVGKSDKLFTRKDVPGRFMHITSQRSEQYFTDKNTNPKMDNSKADFQKTADDIMLRKYTPAGVVVNEAMDIVHFRGNTGNYLQQSPGKPSHNLLKMAKDGLAFELRNILHKAKKQKTPAIKENISVHVNGVLQNISIEALQLPDTIEPHYLVLFHDGNTTGNQQPAINNKKSPASKAKKDDKDLRIQQLENELTQAREDMRSITEDQEAANEELQSANEELLSSSEELQSLNEELETGKEELQSTNEELMVVNQEMISLNEQVTAAKDYAEAIIANIHEPLLVLDKNLRIKTANDAFYRTFRVNENETEAALIYNLGNKQWDIPELRTLLENILPEKSVFNNFEVTHTFSSIGERVMLLNAREVVNKKSSEKLILLSIEDITERTLHHLKETELLNRFQNLVMQAPVSICIIRKENYIVELANDSYLALLEKEKKIINKPLFESLPELENQGFKKIIDGVLETGIPVSFNEMEVQFKRNNKTDKGYFNFGYQPMRKQDGTITGIIAIGYEVTAQVLAAEKINESEKQFRLVAELMPQKIWTSDAEGNKNYFNQTLLDYAGLSFEELKGAGWQKIIHPEDWKDNEKHWQESIGTGKNYEAENRLLRKDGKYLWHLTRAVPLKDEQGNIKMWVGSKTEIQEQKTQKEELQTAVAKRTFELEEANKALFEKNKELLLAKEKLLTEYSRSLIEASLDPLVTISVDGKITDVNEASVLATGIQRDQLIGTSFSNYFTETEKAQQGYEQAFEKGFVADYPLTLKHKNGKLKDVLYNASVYKNDKGEVAGVFAAARDVTEQKRISTELTEAIVLAEMATAIAEEAKGNAEQLTHIAEDAAKAKQQFLSTMSHEIRTPMNAIIGFTKVVLKTDLTDKQREYLNAIKISGDALIVLINDILDLAKVDAGKMTFEQTLFKPALSISTMLHLFDTKIKEKNVELVKEYDEKIPEVLIGDPARLHQIILNLLSNAVKFTAKGKITVSVNLLKEDEEKATIEFAVVDTGIGIPENKLGKVFENFQQVSGQTSRLYGGTGLGLAIAKHLVEAQGGSIHVKSEINKGATFSFILDFKKTKAELPAETEIVELDRQIKGIRVLVAEDVALNQLLMQTLLDDFGFEYEIAANGKIAIEKLKAKKYDIILMDLQMSEMNGFEATEYIRNEMHDDIPIIALTADVTTVDLEKCRKAGMNDYIAKPVDEGLLYKKIIGLTKKTPVTDLEEMVITGMKKKEIIKSIDLQYLKRRTKSNPVIMMEMIVLYLKQTPSLIQLMKESFIAKDWIALHSAVHKMIPSFIIMGINPDYEVMAKKVQDYAGAEMQQDGIHDLIKQLEVILVQSCNELEEEYNNLKNMNT